MSYILAVRNVACGSFDSKATTTRQTDTDRNILCYTPEKSLDLDSANCMQLKIIKHNDRQGLLSA